MKTLEISLLVTFPSPSLLAAAERLYRSKPLST
jgi:hypothetical protein